MTVFENSVRIDAPIGKVWNALSSLESLSQYDPGVTSSEIVTAASGGIGAVRRCRLKDGGWLTEKVTDWQPARTLAFELTDCTLPVRRLTHSYLLTANAGGTIVQQRMEYELKFGWLGKLLDSALVKKKWEAGIHRFLDGLKHYAERSGRRD